MTPTGNARPDLAEMFVHPTPAPDVASLTEGERAALWNTQMALFQHGGAATRAELLTGTLRGWSGEKLDAQLRWLLQAGRIVARQQYAPDQVLSPAPAPELVLALSQEAAEEFAAYFAQKAARDAERAASEAAVAAVKAGEAEVKAARAAARIAQDHANEKKRAADQAGALAARAKAAAAKAAQTGVVAR